MSSVADDDDGVAESKLLSGSSGDVCCLLLTRCGCWWSGEKREKKKIRKIDRIAVSRTDLLWESRVIGDLIVWRSELGEYNKT